MGVHQRWVPLLPPAMLDIFNVIIPGVRDHRRGAIWPCVSGSIPPREPRGLVAFVNNFATPCLLCEAMLTSDFSTTFNPAVIWPFYIGALFSMLVGALVARNLFRQRPGESVASGFSAMFTNTVLIGIPVIQRAYGPAALPTVFSIIAFHAPMLITLGMLVMELVRRDGAPLGRTLLVALVPRVPESAAMGRRGRRRRQLAAHQAARGWNGISDHDVGRRAARLAVRAGRRPQRIQAQRKLKIASLMSLLKLMAQRPSPMC